jgi:hypothetical protein
MVAFVLWPDSVEHGSAGRPAASSRNPVEVNPHAERASWAFIVSIGMRGPGY